MPQHYTHYCTCCVLYYVLVYIATRNLHSTILVRHKELKEIYGKIWLEATFLSLISVCIRTATDNQDAPLTNIWAEIVFASPQELKTCNPCSSLFFIHITWPLWLWTYPGHLFSLVIRLMVSLVVETLGCQLSVPSAIGCFFTCKEPHNLVSSTYRMRRVCSRPGFAKVSSQITSRESSIKSSTLSLTNNQDRFRPLFI